jgi:8-amino-7-oxononanoate synthase
MHDEDWLHHSLAELREQHLERTIATFPAAGAHVRRDGREVLNFSSNDYLDLARHPQVLQAAADALQRYGAGATSSRLVTGSLALHDELESELARFKGYPCALVFGSGYMANAGVITALVGRGDLVAVDRLVHASVVDAAQLSRARLARFRHNDAGHLRDLLDEMPARRRLVVTESVFSMDGDVSPLREIVLAAREKQAMVMVDEAHATGIQGPGGAGLISSLGLQADVDISMGTLSKSFGSYGGYVAVPELLRRWLVTRARALIYTTAPPPPSIGAALGALRVLRQQPGLGAGLLARAATFRKALQDAGLNVGNSQSQIIPVMIGEASAAIQVARRLECEGILALPMREPTVPRGTARLRLSVTLGHAPDELADAAQRIARAVHEELQPAQ